MAMDLVPGFKVVDHPPRPGQPKRPMLEDIELLADVWRLKEKQPGLTVSAAVKILVSKPKSRWFGKNKHTLEKIVGKALRSREIRDFFRIGRRIRSNRTIPEIRRVNNGDGLLLPHTCLISELLYLGLRCSRLLGSSSEAIRCRLNIPRPAFAPSG